MALGAGEGAWALELGVLGGEACPGPAPAALCSAQALSTLEFQSPAELVMRRGFRNDRAQLPLGSNGRLGAGEGTAWTRGLHVG